MHELALEVQERERAVEREIRSKLDDAGIMSGATSPAPRAIARMRPVRMPGADAGSTTRRIV
jgi:hypothetical protein